ncbi:unnamed protein product [Paramecium sonneborni]|uniref:Insulin-like growth factor binding protein, N-terminal n=1 Tax=Paramecium sonneborni TaxID=65129 RepID=A0A8S1N2M0_9CILI|nr:unnamed protein product [Paramecium sonneborni]
MEQHPNSRIALIIILLFLGCLSQIFCFQSYEEAILSSSIEVLEQSVNVDNSVDGNTYGIGFWSMSVPLMNNKQNIDFDNPYDSSKGEFGQLLMLMQDSETKSNSILVSLYLDYENLKVQHKVQIIDQLSTQMLIFKFDGLVYEGKWIFNLILIQPKLQMVLVQMSDQEKQTVEFNSETQLNLKFILGGRGYINDMNLNTFKGVLSRLIFIPSLFYTETTFDDLIKNNIIPQKKEGEKIINIVFGLHIFDGTYAQQQTIDQYGNKYILSGWAKYIIKDGDDKQYTLLRMTAFLNYEHEIQLGDELFMIEVFLSNSNPEQTKMIVNADAFSMPIQQSFQSQFDSTFQGSQNSNYQIVQSKRIFQNLNNKQYYEGLQQWHYIQYEYGRSNSQERMLFQSQFYNELGLITESLGNDIFGGSFTNYKFYLFFGRDNFNNNLLQAEIYDFKISFNYNEDKEFIQYCHNTCLTCDGPLYNNCLSCDENQHRYFQIDTFQCRCLQGYFEFEQGKCTDQFYSSISLSEDIIENPFSIINQLYIVFRMLLLLQNMVYKTSLQI